MEACAADTRLPLRSKNFVPLPPAKSLTFCVRVSLAPGLFVLSPALMTSASIVRLPRLSFLRVDGTRVGR